MTSQDKANKLAEFADDIKAERIEILNLRGKSSVTDYFVVCTGNSQVHADAIAERSVEKARAAGFKPLRRTDTAQSDGWILVDYGDVVMHVMLEEKRQFYDLETLWESLPPDPNLVMLDE